MPNAWNGADPVAQGDGNDYELGTEFRANVDITITHIRVYAPAGETNFPGRLGRIWTTAGSLLGQATLPTDLPTGWSVHALDTPVERTANQRWVVSYSTGGSYGALIDGLLASDVNSADAAVTALRDVNSTNGNGAFNTTPGAFPTTSPAAHFYGADVVYEIGLASNTAPRITGALVQANGAQATVTITAEDDESLVDASYRVDWGDGTSPSVSATPVLSHTYTRSGLFPLLLSVTDDGGLSDFEARYVRIVVPAQEPLRPSFIYQDAEQLVINYLRPILAARPEPWLTGLKIGNKKPETSKAIPPDRVLFVRRIGGQSRSHLDLARIDFKCYGRDEAEAQDLAALVLALMQASVNHSGITTVTPFLGLTNAPDDLSNAPRYMFTLELEIEGSPLV